MDSNYSISLIAEALIEEHEELAERLGIDRTDVAMALACACGGILASDAKLSRATALSWMEDLRLIIQTAYELHAKKTSPNPIRLADLERIMSRFARPPHDPDGAAPRHRSAAVAGCGSDSD